MLKAHDYSVFYEFSQAPLLLEDINAQFETEAHCSEDESELDELMFKVLNDDSEQAYCFLNERKLRKKVQFFKDNYLPNDSRARLIYAVKANSRRRILSILDQEGIDGFDCASLNEVLGVLSSTTVDSSSVYFNHPVRTDRATKRAIDESVSYFTAHCREGIDQVIRSLDPKNSFPTEVAIRVETTNSDAAIPLSSKFGCLPEEAKEYLAYIQGNGLKKGLTMHVGSQNLNPESYFNGLKILRDIAIESGGVSSINLGGGFPVDYRGTGQVDLGHHLRTINGAVAHLLNDAFVERKSYPEIIIEPGRGLIADSIDLAIPILSVHERNGEKRLFMGDGIFTSFSDAKIHKWPYYFEHFRPDGRSSAYSSSTYKLYGRTCDGGDTLGEVELPHGIKKGDFLHVRNAGAYHDSQSSFFNGFEPPKYISYNL